MKNRTFPTTAFVTFRKCRNGSHPDGAGWNFSCQPAIASKGTHRRSDCMSSVSVPSPMDLVQLDMWDMWNTHLHGQQVHLDLGSPDDREGGRGIHKLDSFSILLLFGFEHPLITESTTTEGTDSTDKSWRNHALSTSQSSFQHLEWWFNKTMRTLTS